MALFSFTERSIFFRIYAGLLLVCFMVAFFAYFFVSIINEARLQAYREDVATGVFYLISEGVSRQQDELSREYWLVDAGNLFGSTFEILPIDSVAFKAKEEKRLSEDKSVVRYDTIKNETHIYQKINGENNILSVKVAQVGERQVRAMAVFLLDDLSYYSTLAAKRARLEFLSAKFEQSISLKDLGKLSLDREQMMRLNLGDPVILFEDGVSQTSTISVVIPADMQGMAIVVSAIPLFNWFPINLLASMVSICMLLISLGVYALIFPLERRLQLLQIGVKRVSEGQLDTKVQVVGEDDIARLSSTFNVMTTHIGRLIEAQRELTRAVSHELRTPVARIRFAVDMLADEDDADSRQLQKNYIDEDIEALNELIDEILTYAKLEEGSPKMNWEMVDAGDLLEQIVKETNALGKDIKVQAVLPNAKTVVMADRRYLHRVLQNLAGNALRYANQSIVVSAWVKSGRAYISVEDDGHGIAEADRDKVFVPFSRLDDSRTRASGGYGLGLSIVSRIAFWFQGEMGVDSSPTLGGARFTMNWPVRQIGVIIAAEELVGEAVDKKIIGDDGLS
ncbi:MAG: ATP-binding protein [Moraxella sp.]|nr:ATP-binding protein [Moraxella sp.]